MSSGPMSDEPVSWLVIERGWTVVGPDGAELGAVDEVLGDAESDIWNGLVVASGLLGTTRQYVPATLVEGIHENRVELSISGERLEALQAEVEPPGHI